MTDLVHGLAAALLLLGVLLCPGTGRADEGDAGESGDTSEPGDTSEDDVAAAGGCSDEDMLHLARLHALDARGKLTGPFLVLEGFASLLSDVADGPNFAATFGYAAKGGYRWSGWGVFLQAEHNLWMGTDTEKGVVQGAVNLGVGAEVTYARGFVRTSLALGPSVLAEDTILDDAGKVGLFLDVRPVGLRWTVHEHIVIGLDPISFAVVAPVLGAIPLALIQYRTTLVLEWVL